MLISRPSFGDAGEDPALQLAGKGGESQKTSPPWRTYTYHVSDGTKGDRI